MKEKIKAGIAGGAGYTGGELLRILLYHPDITISFIHSNSHAGQSVASVHQDLLGETSLKFTNQIDNSIEVLFLCVGHGQARAFLNENSIPENIRIIDLSQDFRLQDENHNFIYGLPELQKEAIRKASRIANPGCFATGIQLALLPLAHADLLQYDVHVNAITGSTGAGQKPTATSHFSWRDNNVSVYKTFTHQHMHEIRQSLRQLQHNFDRRLFFVPVRGNFTRGIFTTAYLPADISMEELANLYKDFYEEAPFVHITDENPDLKQIINTNKCILYLEKHDDVIFVVSILDNLIKGASGQAVQNMNLMFGLNEQAGLNLKPVRF